MSKLLVGSLAGAGVLVGLYAAAGYIGVPYAVKWAANNYAGLLGKTATVQIKDVSFNPWSWVLEVNQVKVEGADLAKGQFVLQHALVDVSSQSIFELAPVLTSLHIDGMSAKIAYGTRLVKTQKNAAAAAGSPATQTVQAEKQTGALSLPRFSVSDLAITDSAIEVTGKTPKETLTVSEINLALPKVSTLADTGSIPEVNPKISLKIDGKPIVANAQTKAGKALVDIDVPQIDVAKMARIAQSMGLVELPVKLNSALLSTTAHVEYDFNNTNGNGIKLNADVNLARADVADSAGSYAVTAPEMKTRVQVDLARQEAVVNSFRLINPTVQLTLKPESKKTNKATVAQAVTTEAFSLIGSAHAAAPAAWYWKVQEAFVDKGVVTLSDQSVKPAGKIVLTNLNASVKDLASSAKNPGSYKVSLNVAGGSTSVEGKVSVQTLSGTAKTVLKNIRLDAFNAWTRHYSGASFSSGTVDVAGDTTFNAKQKLAVTWKGDLAVKSLTAKKDGSTVMTWKALTAKTLNLKKLDPIDISIDLVTIEQPGEKAVKNASKVLDFASAIQKLRGKSTSKIDKAREKINQSITIKNLMYNESGFYIKGRNLTSVETLGVEALNKVFKKAQ